MSMQKGVYKIFGVPETSEFTKPRVHTNFVAFPSENKNRKEPRKSVRFGPRLFGSSREGTELDWTCFKQFLFE